MLNTSNKNNNNTRILELIKNSVPYYFFIISLTRIQHVTLIRRKGIFYIPSFRSIVCMYWYRLHKSGFKRTPVVLLCPTMKGLVEDTMCNIQISTEGMMVISGTVTGS